MNPFIIIAICIAIILLALLIVDIVDLNRFVVRKYDIKSDKIEKDFTFVMISDLHNKDYGNGNEKVFQEIKKADPDFIIIAGDIITAHPKQKNLNAKAFVQKLASEYTVYYGMGNHEYRAGLYPEDYGNMYEEYMSILQEAGANVLINDSVELPEYGIRIAGLQIDRRFYKRFRVVKMEDDYISSEIGPHSEKDFEILIGHNPDYFPMYAKYGADLSLSGHVHGGLIRIPVWGGIASPGVRFFPKYNGGMYTIGDKKCIVSCGLGTHSIPLRMFNPGELSVVTCAKEEKRIK